MLKTVNLSLTLANSHIVVQLPISYISILQSPTQVCMKYRERLRKYSVRQVCNCLQRIKQKGGKGLSEDYGEFEFLGFFINVYLHVI